MSLSLRLLLVLVAVTTAACNAPDFDDAFRPVEVNVTGRVLDSSERARFGSEVTFFRHACHPDSTELTRLVTTPTEVRTDHEGRFFATLIVDSNRRGRPDACLQVRAQLSRWVSDAMLGLWYPDSTAVPVRVTNRTVELDIRVPAGAPFAEPLYSSRLTADGQSSVQITTTIRNNREFPIRVLLRSPCTVMHRVYEGASTDGPPAWDEEWTPGGCKAGPLEVQIGALDSLVHRRTISAAQLFNVSWYPPGRLPPAPGALTFESVIVQLSPDPKVVRVRAGTAVLGQIPIPVIAIEPAHATIAPGDSVRFTVHGLTQPVWRSEHPEIAAVGANGVAIGRARGQAVITAIAATDTTRRAYAVLTVQ